MNHIQGKCSTCYNVNINGANLYNIKSCTHFEDSRTTMYTYIYKNKRVFLPVFAKMNNIIEKGRINQKTHHVSTHLHT